MGPDGPNPRSRSLHQLLPKDPNRPTVLLRQVTRHRWANSDEVIVVALIQQDGASVARAFGVRDGRAVEVDRLEGATLQRSARPRTLVGADGATWELRSAGCSCNVPRQLRGLNPLGVPSP